MSSCLNVLDYFWSYLIISSWFILSPPYLGLAKSPFNFFHKIKDIFFIFTNNFIDLDILSMSTISHCWLLLVATHLAMHETPPQQRIFLPKYKYYQQTLQKFTFDTFDQSQHLLQTPHNYFLFHLHFYLSWNNKS